MITSFDFMFEEQGDIYLGFDFKKLPVGDNDYSNKSEDEIFDYWFEDERDWLSNFMDFILLKQGVERYWAKLRISEEKEFLYFDYDGSCLNAGHHDVSADSYWHLES